ncbi:kinocilin [Lepisosteus oculatus]|uniref:kinocilin n=1 Tax=Lepisosteus oculatus TaxID=7918 RepID=UPI003710BBDE
MNAVSISEFHCLRVSCALLSIVAGCIIIGVSRDCGADAVGGIFLGAGGLGLIISIYPFIKAWFNFNHILPVLGNFRVHPRPHLSNAEQPAEAFKREATQAHLDQELSKSRMGTFQDAQTKDLSPEEGPSSDTPDIIAKRKFKQSPSD